MSDSLKVLIVRFSSIGDIVLTSPIVRALKKQKNAQIHFLTKSQYSSIVVNNLYIDKVITIHKSLNEIKEDLIKENYDFVIDLHNNIRSHGLRFLNVPIKRYSKSNFKKLIYMYTGKNFLNNEHVVDRYFKATSFLDLNNDGKGLDFFIDKKDEVDFDINQKFISWCIGASKEQKKLAVDQICYVANKLNLPIVLLGGMEESNKANQIINQCSQNKIYNYCGNITINQSAYLIKHSQILLSNDTGLMHIGAALDKKIISFWGCTKPDLGFYPYIKKPNSLMIISELSKRQCSKHGSSCRFTADGCVKKINPKEIFEKVTQFIS